MGLHVARLVAVGSLLIVGVFACSSTSGDAAAEATPNPNGKTEGSDCKIGFDCRSGLCTDGRCAPSATSLSSPAGDCGGSRASKCADGKPCDVAADCMSGVCTAKACAVPSPTDGVKNGDETDVDCGGSKAPKCATGKTCLAHADCTSDACSYDKKCVEMKGCTGHFGGDTCGEGETGAPDAKHESCCTVVNIADRPGGQGGAFKMDKYLVTAGRMRAFAERYKGNLKQWAAGTPKGWDPSLSGMLPENMDDVNILLGPNGKRGCNVASQGGRTWFQGPVDGNPAEKSDFTQDVLDEKALNCVPWYMAAAVCAFDGGHLVSTAEMAWVYENRGRAGGSTNYPWQWNDTSGYNPQSSDIRIVHRNSYQTPNPPASMRLVNGQYPLDHAFWIAPPGRRPKGANMHGVMDAAGNVMPWVRDNQGTFTWTQSWENHEKKLQTSTWTTTAPEAPDGYYAIGARCTY